MTRKATDVNDVIPTRAFALMFNTHHAETSDDAAIERLTQETMKFMIHRAEKRKMAMGDIICAAQEVLARLTVAPLLEASDHDDKARADAEVLIGSMMTIAHKRA